MRDDFQKVLQQLETNIYNKAQKSENITWKQDEQSITQNIGNHPQKNKQYNLQYQKELREKANTRMQKLKARFALPKTNVCDIILLLATPTTTLSMQDIIIAQNLFSSLTRFCIIHQYRFVLPIQIKRSKRHLKLGIINFVVFNFCQLRYLPQFTQLRISSAMNSAQDIRDSYSNTEATISTCSQKLPYTLKTLLSVFKQFCCQQSSKYFMIQHLNCLEKVDV
ncbi:unnamed protein product [Paramecium octaurelia]|uniref:Uncharacterized protein n=1 Tax=Paramecium octaurelia TaxID=43137 RepID=A0A8S1W3Z6_PAROT|nr:unnamed protein product [Paramecium octaurelia]